MGWRRGWGAADEVTAMQPRLLGAHAQLPQRSGRDGGRWRQQVPGIAQQVGLQLQPQLLVARTRPRLPQHHKVRCRLLLPAVPVPLPRVGGSTPRTRQPGTRLS